MHLSAIDALRFGCAAAVLAYHVGTVFPLAESSATRMFGLATLPTGAAPWTAWGWIGVEIFFVLSGYVIAMSIRRGDRAAFARARLLRLFPAGIVCATITALVLAASGAVPLLDIATRWAASLTMLPFGPRIDGVWWTLQVEVGFYLLVAAAVRGRDDRRRVERLGCALSLWSGGYWLIAFATGRIVDGMAEPAMLVLLPHGGLFALGIAIHALTRGRTMMRLAALALALPAAFAEIVARAVAADGAGGVAANPLVPVAAFLGAVTVLAAARVLESHMRWRAAFARLGRATYPLYLVNQLAGAATIVVLVRLGLPPALAMMLAAIAMLWLADAIARHVEPAIRRSLAAGISPPRAPPPDTLPTASLPTG